MWMSDEAAQWKAGTWLTSRVWSPYGGVLRTKLRCLPVIRIEKWPAHPLLQYWPSYGECLALTIRGRAHCTVLQEATVCDEKTMCGASLPPVFACVFISNEVLPSPRRQTPLTFLNLNCVMCWWPSARRLTCEWIYIMSSFCLLKYC